MNSEESTFQIAAMGPPDVLLKYYIQPAVAAIAQKIEGDLLHLYAGFIDRWADDGGPHTETIQ